jgi:hypothetical protein
MRNNNRLALSIGLLAPALLISPGCQDSTAPETKLLHASAISQASPPNSLVAFADASERILPAMADEDAAQRLRKQFTDFSIAYAAGDKESAARTLAGIRKVLARLDATEHPANLSAIRLSLLSAESLLTEVESDSTAR